MSGSTIRSMTGFGAANAEVDGSRYAVEIRSVNNKFLKTVVRLPDDLAALETDLETAVSRRLRRGSVMVTVRWTPGGNAMAARVDDAAARAVVEQLLRAMPDSIRDRCSVDLGSLLQVPGITGGEDAGDLLEEARPVILRLLDEACDGLLEMRTHEGDVVREELRGFGVGMRSLLETIADRAPQVVEQYRDRLHHRVESLLADVGKSLDESDLVREVAIFAERSDIAEEVVRLGGHLDQFFDLLDRTGGEPVGRTLDFLAQEMLREANTIASKSADTEIARSVVEVKGLIDRVKEQAANVE
ncbi:MAG: YicC/YloC family endoribonuclease [Planctomycetota bacterium]|nr:YicC/YloC family endoribonuclease [Planctomycetota bacterium]